MKPEIETANTVTMNRHTLDLIIMTIQYYANPTNYLVTDGLRSEVQRDQGQKARVLLQCLGLL
jgi:hypothetical protein